MESLSVKEILICAAVALVILVAITVINLVKKLVDSKVTQVQEYLKNSANDSNSYYFQFCTSILDFVKTEIIEKTVIKLNETLVKEYKAAAEDGKITKDEAVEIFNTAVTEIKSLLTDNVKAELSVIIGDLDTWIASSVESTLKEIKDKSKTE